MNTALEAFGRDSGNLRNIPGIGEKMERRLMDLGVFCTDDLVGLKPEDLYEKDCRYHGQLVDRCVLYVMRLAVYYAEHENHEPEKLKWWYWKNQEYRPLHTIRSVAE